MSTARLAVGERLSRRKAAVLVTYALAIVVALAPLFVTVALIDVAGTVFLAAGLLRLAVALPEASGLSRFAGATALVLGAALLAASGEGLWSLPVLFATYLVVEAVLRFVQALRHQDLRLYSAGVIATLIALGIWLDIFCGGYGLFGPLVALDLAATAWAFGAAS